MNQQLLQDARDGDLNALKQLINQAFAKRNIAVKQIDLTEGVLTIEMRCLQGEIEASVLDSIRNNAEKLKIKGVERVEVSQYKAAPASPPVPPKTQVRKIVSKPPSLWSEPWVKGVAGLIVLVGLGIPAFNFYQEQAICKTKSGEPAHQELNKIALAWQDSLELADNVNRMGLPNQISQMQSMRRDLENADWNECATKAVDLLGISMQAAIDALVLFLDPDEDESKIREKFKAGASAREAYSAAYLELLPPSEKTKARRQYYEKQAQDHLGMVRFAQFFHYLQASSFTNDEEKLTELSFSEVTGLGDYYSLGYSLDTPELFTATALSQRGNMKSYALGMVGNQWIICASTEASKTISLPVGSEKSVSCGDDSIQVEGEGEPTE